MTYQELYRFGVSELNDGKIEDAEQNARELLLGISGLSRFSLMLSADQPVDPAVEAQYRRRIARRKQRYPLQYLLGEWDFYGLTLKVGEGVLIPRPETELLVEITLDFLKQKKMDRPVQIWDLCAGSGCVGIAIAANCENCRVFSLEKSETAFSYLQENIKLCGLSKCVTPVPGDLLAGPAALPKDLPYEPDIIVSNPPYIPAAELPGLQPEVQFEPSMALDGGKDGLMFYRAIASLWLPKLAANGLAVLECAEDQGTEIAGLFRKVSSKVRCFEDYAGLPRGVVVRT